MKFSPIQNALGVTPLGTTVTCVNKSGSTLVVGDLVITSFIHSGVVVDPQQETNNSYVFNCIRKASASESGNAGYLGVVTKLLTGAGINGLNVEVQFGGICSARVLVDATVSAGTLLGVSATAGVLSNTVSNSNYSVTLMDNAAAADGTALKRVFIPNDYEKNLANGLNGVVVAGITANGLNYTFNSSFNTISPSTPGVDDSNSNTISGGGNSAKPNLILNDPGEPDCAYRTIGGGYDNVIGSTNLSDGAIASTIAGGAHMRIRRPTTILDAPNPALIGGAIIAPTTDCLILSEPNHSTIGGGSYNAVRNGNYGTIAGGTNNTIMGEDSGATVRNVGSAATIAGGELHWASGNNSTIGGGSQNIARQIYATIAGGVSNVIKFLDTSLSVNNASTIAGGNGNKIYNASGGTIAGGATNAIGGASDANFERGNFSTISGGRNNNIATNATYAGFSNIGGGDLNTVNTWWATIIGGYNNLVSPSSFPNGEYSVAMGRDAECQHHMTVVQGGGIFTGAVRGSAQTQTSVLKVATSTATTTPLATGGGPASAGELAMPSDCLWGFRVMVVGRQTTANNNCAWEITGLATNDAGAAAIVGTPTVTALNTVPVGWGSPTVSVTGSSTRLFFNVTGATATTIRWVARVEITQVLA